MKTEYEKKFIHQLLLASRCTDASWGAGPQYL